MDERLWLLSTAYNTGVECLQWVVPSFRVRLTLSKVRVALPWRTRRNDGLSALPSSVGSFQTAGYGRKRYVRRRRRNMLTMHRLPRLSPDIKSLQRTTDALHHSTHSFARLMTFCVHCCHFPPCITRCMSLVSVVFFLLQCDTCVIIAPHSL